MRRSLRTRRRMMRCETQKTTHLAGLNTDRLVFYRAFNPLSCAVNGTFVEVGDHAWRHSLVPDIGFSFLIDGSCFGVRQLPWIRAGAASNCRSAGGGDFAWPQDCGQLPLAGGRDDAADAGLGQERTGVYEGDARL